MLAIEAAAVLALAIAPLPEQIPRVLPLFLIACAARWIRGKSWGQVATWTRGYAWIGVAAGAIALVTAVVIGTPVVEALTGGGVEWSQWPMVRGSAGQMVAVATVVGASAVCAELALRGWIVERVLERGGAAPLAIVVGASAEALLVTGSLGPRLGAGVFGIAMGWMYVAAGRSVVGSLPARLAFALGAVALETLRWIG